MRIVCLTLCVFLLAARLQAQSITRTDLPRFKVEINSKDGRDYLMVTFGVSMSDCIKAVEVRNLDNNRIYIARPNLDNYFQRDGESEDIYAKVPIGRAKKLISNKNGFKGEVTIISKTGKRIYQGKTDFVIEGISDKEDMASATALH
jgi:hypothetical protein